MNRVLVDANVLLDVLTDDPQWYDWSAPRLDSRAARAQLCIDPIVRKVLSHLLSEARVDLPVKQEPVHVKCSLVKRALARVKSIPRAETLEKRAAIALPHRVRAAGSRWNHGPGPP